MATNQSPPQPPVISVRGTEGLYLLTPSQSDYSKLSRIDNFQDESKNCRCSTFDNTGRYFAYCNSVNINIVDVANNCIVLASINKPRTSYLKFSSQGNYLVAWETFYVAKEDQREVPNLNIYETATGQLVQSSIQKKLADRFVEWSSDDSFFAVLSGSEILFYETKSILLGRYSNKLRIENLSSFTMHPKSKVLAVHGAGKKSEPSFIRLYQYPNMSAPLASKSFFNADKVEFKWNHHGNNLLLLCSTETSANSYYGDSTLHQVNLKGESQLVQLSKKGPIYSVEWNPVKDEFIVVYGTMPAKATLYNSKCEAIYEFGTGPRNECFYSPHGNIVCLAGFGNLRGRIEVWNVSSSNKVPQEITTIQVDDVTFFQWSPDGEHMLTATTAPRLRVSNGFKVWNYLGENKFTHMVPTGNSNELWQVQWQPGVYPVKLVDKKATPVAKEETKAYVPPHLRGAASKASGSSGSSIKSKLHDDDEKPDNKLKAKSTEKSEAEVIEKKIKTVKKKLAQIDELKERQAKGETLEKNQLDKLKSEAELLVELKKLGI